SDRCSRRATGRDGSLPRNRREQASTAVETAPAGASGDPRTLSQLCFSGGLRPRAQPAVQTQGNTEPAEDEQHVERSEPGDAHRGQFADVDDARLQDIAGALAEGVDSLLRLVLGGAS